MNFLENFHEYYDENIKPYESIYRQQRYYYTKKIKRKEIIGYLILALLIIVVFITRASQMLPLYIFILMIIMLVTFGSAEKDKREYVKIMKNKIIAPAIRKCFEQYQYSYTGISEYEFHVAKIYNQYDRFSSSDMIRGKENGKSFAISEIHLERESKDEDGHTSYQTVFRGAFIKMQTSFSVENPIDIKPDIENKLMNLASTGIRKTFGLNKNVIRLENPEFERYFEVYCANQLEARKVLTIDFLERFLELREKYNVKIYFRFEKDMLYMMIRNLKVIDDEDILRKGLSKGTMYANLKVIQDIMDATELITNKNME